MKNLQKFMVGLAVFFLLLIVGNVQNVPAIAEAESAYQLYVIPSRTVVPATGEKVKIDIFLKASVPVTYLDSASADVRFKMENAKAGGFSQEEIHLMYDKEKEGWYGKTEFFSGIRNEVLKTTIVARVFSTTNFPAEVMGMESNRVDITVMPDVRIAQNYVKLDSQFLILSAADYYTGQMRTAVENAIEGIQWSSSNPSVVTVDANGVIRAVGRGGALITALSPASEFVSCCFVSVVGFTEKVSSISMDGEFSLSQYMTLDFASKVTVLPENASNKTFYLESSNPEVAYFVGTELIPKANGTTTVKATTYDGGHTAECKVTVTGISGTGEKQEIQAKSVVKTYGSKPFQLKVKTSDACELEYSSSNQKVAAISKTGKVTVKGYGKTTITIKAQETQMYQAAEKQITVKVVPKRAVIKKLYSNGKKKIFCSWKKDSTVTAYQIAVSEKKKFAKGISENFLKKSFGLSGLKSGKTYYVRIRAYKKVNGKKYYGAWSKIKAVKVK